MRPDEKHANVPIRARDGVVHIEMATPAARTAVDEFLGNTPNAGRVTVAELLRLLRAHCGARQQRLRVIEVEEARAVAYVVIG